MYLLWYTHVVEREQPIRVVFFRTETGSEPVRKWLKDLAKDEKKIIGEDIKDVEFSWPIGMPLVRSLGRDLWEVRSRLAHGRVAVRHAHVGRGDADCRRPGTDLRQRGQRWLDRGDRHARCGEGCGQGPHAAAHGDGASEQAYANRRRCPLPQQAPPVASGGAASRVIPQCSR